MHEMFNNVGWRRPASLGVRVDCCCQPQPGSLEVQPGVYPNRAVEMSENRFRLKGVMYLYSNGGNLHPPHCELDLQLRTSRNVPGQSLRLHARSRVLNPHRPHQQCNFTKTTCLKADFKSKNGLSLLLYKRLVGVT